MPDEEEIERCGKHLERELAILRPELIIAVGRLAISQVLGRERFPPGALLGDVVGKPMRASFRGHECDVICLPHPSGLSSWHKTEPGKTLLRKALRTIARHPAWRASQEA